MTGRNEERWRADSYEPWVAAGPGWANAGVTIHEESARGNRRRRTIYRGDLPNDALLLFPHALDLYVALGRALGIRREWGDGPTCPQGAARHPTAAGSDRTGCDLSPHKESV